MSDWQAVSFITEGTPYEEEVKKLTASASKLDVPLHVYSYRPVGSWRGNLNYKSACIRRAFDDYPDKDIVFVDADAVFRKWPALFDELSAKHEHDLSACFYSYRPESGDRDELLSGTLWIQNGETGRAIVRRWHEIGIKRADVRHQMCLKLAIAELQNEGRALRIFRHPYSYTCIFDYPRMRQGGEPVIEHFQASRRNRRIVGFGQPLLTHQDPGLAPAAPARRRTTAQANRLDVMKRHVKGRGQ